MEILKSAPVEVPMYLHTCKDTSRPFSLTCVVRKLLSPDPDVKYTYIGEYAIRQIKGNVDYGQFVSLGSNETSFRTLLPLNKHI